MKKYIIYTVLLISGLLLGRLIFQDSANQQITHDHKVGGEGADQIWTCTMHPQIRLSEFGDCPICGMELTPVAPVLKEDLTTNQFRLTKNAMALANVETFIVGDTIAEGATVKLSGKILVNENKTATQPAHFNGRIEKLYVNSLGEDVKMGQAIAQIYSPELIAAQQELITAYRIRETQPELYKAVRSKFKNLKINDTQLSEIETTGQVKSQFTIYSHVSGTVSDIIVNKGAHIMDGHPIFKVTNLSTVWANFDVYEHQISQFKKGQELIIKTNAYPNKEFKAKISFIDPILNTKTRTVTVRATLNNKKNLFKPGMFIEGSIENAIFHKTTKLSIPTTAVLWTGKRSVVYIKTNPNEPIFEMKEITLGEHLGANYQVLEGVNNGDEIVVNGTFTVDAAAQLQGKKSMMNKNIDKINTEHKGHSYIKIPVHKENKTVTKEEQKIIDQLDLVINDYMKLKDVLITDDSKKITKQAGNLLDNLNHTDIKLVTNNTALVEKWEKLVLEIKRSIKLMIENMDIKNQRIQFQYISSSLIMATNTFGVNKTMYSQFCPMADDNKGAYWLSDKEEIINPYFGGEMLACGTIDEVIE